MEKTSNIRAKFFIASTVEFKANNLFGQWETDNIYKVYSYGFHFPIYGYDKRINKWYQNIEKYSICTLKHQSQCRLNVEYIPVTTNQLKELIG